MKISASTCVLPRPSADEAPPAPSGGSGFVDALAREQGSASGDVVHGEETRRAATRHAESRRDQAGRHHGEHAHEHDLGGTDVAAAAGSGGTPADVTATAAPADPGSPPGGAIAPTAGTPTRGEPGGRVAGAGQAAIPDRPGHRLSATASIGSTPAASGGEPPHSSTHAVLAGASSAPATEQPHPVEPAARAAGPAQRTTSASDAVAGRSSITPHSASVHDLRDETGSATTHPGSTSPQRERADPGRAPGYPARRCVHVVVPDPVPHRVGGRPGGSDGPARSPGGTGSG